MNLYEHQEKGLELIRKHLYGIFLMTCGSGKSRIYREAAKEARSTLILVPRKILVDQLYDDYFANMVGVDVLKLNSDHRATVNVSKPATAKVRKPRKLTPRQQNALKESRFAELMDAATIDKPFVVIANYQSIRRLGDLLDGRLFDLAFFDEGHNVLLQPTQMMQDSTEEDTNDSESEPEDSALSSDDAVQSLLRPIKRKKMCKDFKSTHEQMQKLRQFNGLNGFPSKRYFFCTATATTMMTDNPQVYGPVLIEYTYNEAVQQGIVKKFRLHVECLQTSIMGQESSVDQQSGQFLWSIGQFISKQNLRRVIVYTNRIKNDTKHKSLRASMALETFREQERAIQHHRVKVEYITHHTTIDQRQTIFNNFRKTSDTTTRMIVSCRTISEGVDLTSADAVILLDSRSNNITTTQRILRCTRLTQEERRHGTWGEATVLIPLMKHTISSFTENQELKNWLDRFVVSLGCRSQLIIPPEPLNDEDDDERVSIPIYVGESIDSIPFDPLERTKDPKRTNARTLLLRKIPDIGENTILRLEEGIFHYVLDQSRHLHFARNWDDKRFGSHYVNRCMLLIASIERKPDLLSNTDDMLYKIARQWTREQLRPSLYGATKRKDENVAIF